MGPWEAGQGRGSRRGAPVQLGSGVGVGKPQTVARLALVTEYLQSQGEDRACSGGAVPQQLCAAAPVSVQPL